MTVTRRARRWTRVRPGGSGADAYALNGPTLEQADEQANGHAAHLGERLVDRRQRRRTVVACSESSKPTTERSSGTRNPRDRAARSAPSAMLSLNAKIAVGGSCRSSSV